MILTITLSISALLIINLLLLKFSCNEIIKPEKANKKPIILHPEFTLEQTEQQLSPTGS